ncbi:MAG: glutathione S-transferase family protein [Magnetovibrio sp.]|nr:glutathione S-transferase family protein [Magnetovibrio sp.]
MAEFELVIGNRNYSSWSLRAWLMLMQTGASAEEIVIPLDQGSYKEDILAHSPAGQVPILKHGAVTVWDSLAIGEYLAERFPDAGLWPDAPDQRARARAVACEMHAGFVALRTHMPMDLRNAYPGQGREAGVAADIRRIIDIWSSALAASSAGPYLFGGFTIADAMYAPVVGRFQTYDVALPDDCRAYADAVWAHPHMRAWVNAARDEPWVIEVLTP